LDVAAGTDYGEQYRNGVSEPKFEAEVEYREELCT
jgi:hypothetical protein